MIIIQLISGCWGKVLWVKYININNRIIYLFGSRKFITFASVSGEKFRNQNEAFAIISR